MEYVESYCKKEFVLFCSLLRKVINKVRENTPSILYFNDLDLLCSTYNGKGLEGLEARRKQLRTEFLEEIWGQPNEFMGKYCKAQVKRLFKTNLSLYKAS